MVTLCIAFANSPEIVAEIVSRTDARTGFGLATGKGVAFPGGKIGFALASRRGLAKFGTS